MNDLQTRIDRYFLHHPDHEQHPAAMFFCELMSDAGTYEQGWEDALEDDGGFNKGYESGYAEAKATYEQPVKVKP